MLLSDLLGSHLNVSLDPTRLGREKPLLSSSVSEVENARDGCPFRATRTQRSGRRSGVGAGSPGTRKEAGERDTGASDRRCGEEVTGGGPPFDVIVCVWAESLMCPFSFFFFFALLRWGLSRPPGAHQLLLHAADEGASARSQSGPELQGGPGNASAVSAVSKLPCRGCWWSHCPLSPLLSSSPSSSWSTL